MLMINKIRKETNELNSKFTDFIAGLGKFAVLIFSSPSSVDNVSLWGALDFVPAPT